MKADDLRAECAMRLFVIMRTEPGVKAAEPVMEIAVESWRLADILLRAEAVYEEHNRRVRKEVLNDAS